MANLVMDFLQHAENFGKGVVQDIANPVAKFGNEVGAFGELLTGNEQGAQNILNKGGGLLHQGGVLGGQELNAQNTQQGIFANKSNVEKAVGTGAEIGSNFIGGGAAKDVAESAAKNGSSKLTLDFIHGAQAGSTAGGVGTAGSEAANGQGLNPEAIAQGAALGGATGGALGAGVPAAAEAFKNRVPLNEAGSINNAIPKPSDQFQPEDLQKMAQNEDPKAIEKQLSPITGPVVAQEIAPAVAHTHDPNVAANIIDNAVNKKVPSLLAETSAARGQTAIERQAELDAKSSQNVQSPAPAETAPLPQPTSVSDVNTPQQVEGQSAEEASLFASQPEPDFLNAPGEEPAITSHSTKAGVMQGMQDILNSGGSTDEALNHYFEQLPEAQPGEAQQALDNVMNSEGIDKSKVNAKLNPQYQNVELPQASSKDAAILNGQYANNKVVQAGTPALQAMQQLDEHDLELVRHIKGNDPSLVINQANDPEQFAKVVSSLKDYNDYTQAAGAHLGQDIPYRQNYGLRTPYLPPEERPTPTGEPIAQQPTNVSYTKQRIYNTHQEALSNGEVPKFGNAIEDLQNDINQRAHDQSQLALAKGLEQAYPGQVKIINQGQIPVGYQQLLIPNGEKIFMPSDIASEINEREASQRATGALGTYDQINAAGKNLELGGGLFHGFNTGGIFTGQQLASGKLFTDPSAAGNVVKNLFSNDATKNYLSELNREGSFDENHSIQNAFDAIGLNLKNVASDVGKPTDEGITGKIASIPGLKQIHQAIFERQIPTMMAETTRQKIQGLDIFGNPEDREQAIKIAKGVNQEFGHLNRDIQGLTPKQFQLASRVLLAADYQEGQLRTLASAFNPKNFGTPEGKLAREAVFGKALLFGGLATLGSAAGGTDFKDQTPSQIALAIMNKAINPSFDIAGYKVGLPATQISNVAKPIEQSVASAKKGNGIAQGPENFASSHLAFVPSKAEEFGTNKNFQGNAVYGKDYFGRPISGAQTAENLVSGVLPIPLAQTAQTATGNQSVGAAIANTVGLNASPQYSLNYAPVAGQSYVQALQDAGASKGKVNSTTQFFDLLGQGSKAKAKTITAAETALKAGDTQKANKLVADYNKQLLQKLLPWEQNGGTSYLDPTMMQLLRTAELTYKKATSNTNYVAKTNPTSIGIPISALASQPQVQQAARQ